MKAGGYPACSKLFDYELEDLAKLVDLVVVGLVHELIFLPELGTHQFAGMCVSGEIAYGEIYTFFDDQLVIANVHHDQLILFLDSGRAFVFAADRIEQDIVGILCKGEEAKLRVVEIALDKMELDQHLLFEQLGAVEQDLMFLEIVDVFYLERGHTYFPDDPAGRGPELNILWRDERFDQVGIIVLLR